MEVHFHSQFPYAHTKLILLAIHIVYIGTLVFLTAFLSFSLGKRKGVREYLVEKKLNLKKDH